MTPIHRIPKLDMDIRTALSQELEHNSPVPPLANSLYNATEHSNDENHLSIMLDWAMEIRSEFGISWAESIELAMTLYFG